MSRIIKFIFSEIAERSAIFLSSAILLTVKTSVLIIAHNEENHIGQCIESLLQQTQKANEIVLIAHNCTDTTQTIAKRYPITTIPFNGPRGIIYARIEGLRQVTGDIILCIDGDSYAAKNWIAVMTKTLKQNNNVLVGSWIKFKGNLFGAISNLTNNYFCVSKGERAAQWIWGPSMAFWGKDTEKVRHIFEESIALSEQLALSRNPDDYWLALFMQQEGGLQVTNKTRVTIHTKETSIKTAIARNKENMRNGNKMKAFFKTLVK